jgi:CBS domain-containing protein
MATLVRHVMTEAPKTLSPERVAGDAAGLMAQYDIGAVPVMQDGELAGIVTDRDLVLRVMARRLDPSSVTLGEILTRVVTTVTPDVQLSEAREVMAEQRIRRLPVVKDGELVGILSLGDVALADASKRAVGETLEEVSESPSTTDRNDGPDPGTPERVREAADRGSA